MANVIITNLSRYNQNSKELEYISHYDKSLKLSGIQTNDAPVKDLISYIKSKNGNVGKILAVTTKEAAEAYTNFCTLLENYSLELAFDIPVPEKVDTADDKIAETIQDIISRINPDDIVYIDTTGGFRNTSYLLMAVVRILEYSDIKVETAVYSNLYANPKGVEDVTETYRMFDLINAVNTFTMMGNSSELKKFFRNSKNETIRETIEAMNRFSDEITLCRTTHLDETLEKLNECLKKLSEEQITENDSGNAILFRSLSSTIRKKFHISDKKIEYVDIIKWCIENNLIQQAITIYTEKMSEYFYKKGFFCDTDESMRQKIEEENSKSKNHKELYSTLFFENLMLDVESANQPTEFVKKVKEEWANTNSTSGIRRIIRDRKVMEAINKLNDIKSIISNRNGQLLSPEKIISGFSSYPEEFLDILRTSTTIKCTAVDKFMNSLICNAKLLYPILGLKNNDSDKHLEFIEQLTLPFNSTKFTLTDKFGLDELKWIFRDCYYIKKFVRNALNHAAVKSTTNAELAEYFSSHGYKTDEELSVNDIKEILGKAIERISKLCED